jgi:2'-5' RNA ligase
LGDFDSISVAVESLDLRIINKLMLTKFHHFKLKPFTPHITIAYVNKNKADNIVGNKHFHGITFESNEFYLNLNENKSEKFTIS